MSRSGDNGRPREAAPPAETSRGYGATEHAYRDLALPFPAELVEAIAGRVAELLIEHQPRPAEPWLDVAGAAAYLACDTRRIYDLTSSRRLRCARDGRRLLFRREWLEAVLEEANPDNEEDT